MLMDTLCKWCVYVIHKIKYTIIYIKYTCTVIIYWNKTKCWISLALDLLRETRCDLKVPDMNRYIHTERSYNRSFTQLFLSDFLLVSTGGCVTESIHQHHLQRVSINIIYREYPSMLYENTHVYHVIWEHISCYMRTHMYIMLYENTHVFHVIWEHTCISCYMRKLDVI
jgi:hypothetical protein